MARFRHGGYLRATLVVALYVLPQTLGFSARSRSRKCCLNIAQRSCVKVMFSQVSVCPEGLGYFWWQVPCWSLVPMFFLRCRVSLVPCSFGRGVGYLWCKVPSWSLVLCPFQVGRVLVVPRPFTGGYTLSFGKPYFRGYLTPLGIPYVIPHRRDMGSEIPYPAGTTKAGSTHPTWRLSVYL